MWFSIIFLRTCQMLHLFFKQTLFLLGRTKNDCNVKKLRIKKGFVRKYKSNRVYYSYFSLELTFLNEKAFWLNKKSFFCWVKFNSTKNFPLEIITYDSVIVLFGLIIFCRFSFHSFPLLQHYFSAHSKQEKIDK